MIRIFLDDERDVRTYRGDHPCYSEGNWINVRPSYFRDFYALNREMVEVISFDHDLGEGQPSGYDFFCEIEKEFHLQGILPPDMVVHSANPSGRIRLTQGIQNLYAAVDQYMKD